MSKQDHEDLKDPYDKRVQAYADVHASNSRKGPPNPKDIMGAKKVDLSLIPSVAMLHLGMAMMDGARKYGPYNWRDYPVELRTYIAAAKRHLDAFLEREETAQDSGVHHLGHAMACCAIILDAMNEESCIDNRPQKTGGYHRSANELNHQCKEKFDGANHGTPATKVITSEEIKKWADDPKVQAAVSTKPPTRFA